MRSVSIYYEMGPCKILFLDHKGTFGFNNQLLVCVFGINATITMDDGRWTQKAASQINWANFQIFFYKKLLLIVNPTESILQEASQTSAWFDNFAFFTEGVFMVSIDDIHLW